MSTVTLDFSPYGRDAKSTLQTGLFINNKFVPAVSGKTISVLDPSTGKEIAKVAEADAADVDIAVEAAHKAFETVWGLNTEGSVRGKMLLDLADAVEANADELAAIEALDNGKAFSLAKNVDVAGAAACLRYYGGWADKNHGKTIEIGESKLAYTRHEPIGVVGQITPWNFPILMLAWKWGPALACGNTIVHKTAEQTPLSALKMAELASKIFPPGVINVLAGYGAKAGAAVAGHMKIDKIAFTGSTLVGRTILKAAADSNLKKVTLELGGKSPSLIFDDCDLEQAVSWAAFGLFFNHGQTCCAGSRVYVQETIYDKFMEAFQAKVAAIKVGNPFKDDTFQGPQVSQIQFDRVMGYIEEGKKSVAPLMGGNRHGKEGYFIEPTVFAGLPADNRLMQEEIFGPVVCVTKFTDQKDLLKQANDSVYGLAAAVFSRDIGRSLEVAHKLRAGTVWVNCYNTLHSSVPFGGFKQSGIGRELGEYALENYSECKAVQVNINQPAIL